jgi:prepilin-type N-terminal cleavage/methylation domain-containing protein
VTPHPARWRGFTLIELVVTLALVSVLALVAVPLYEVTTTRARESELRSSLRQIRTALDAYKAASDSGTISHSAGESGFPPDLVTLVNGVDAVFSQAGSAGAPMAGATSTPGFGSPGFGSTGFGSTGFGSTGFGSKGFGSTGSPPSAAPTATYPGAPAGTGTVAAGPSRLVFLRAVPRDPFFPDQTVPAEQQWNIRAYAAAPDDFSGGADVFDVKSKSTATGMNGIAYKDW